MLVIGGSRGKVGAAALTARAALRAGAGLVTIATPASCWPIVASLTPETMTDPLPRDALTARSRAGALPAVLGSSTRTVLALGPGLGRSASTTAFVRQLVTRSQLPLVIDADALNALAGHADLLQSRNARQVVLTPHPGEMARLAGTTIERVQSDRLGMARAFAVSHSVYVVLKGHRTVIATPAGDAFINPTGNPGMATAGTGDVLTGIIAGWLATGQPARRCRDAWRLPARARGRPRGRARRRNRHGGRRRHRAAARGGPGPLNALLERPGSIGPAR